MISSLCMGGVRTRDVPGSGPLPIPRSKFGCPAVPVRAIARPRLAEVLAKPDWRVALVTGGLATGKTVAVAQWFQTLDPVAREWVTLDASDDRPERFWPTFVLALERAVPGAFAQTAAATNVHRLPPEFLDRLLTAWSAVTDPLVIVLDDVHHLRSAQISEDLGFVVEHLPGGSRMLLTSRVNPRLPVSRWRGRGWLAELRQRDLALTLPETAELFTALGENRLTTSDVERLWRRTEGWAAGLRLTAQLRKSPSAGLSPVAAGMTDCSIPGMSSSRFIRPNMSSRAASRRSETRMALLSFLSALRWPYVRHMAHCDPEFHHQAGPGFRAESNTRR